MTTKEKDKELVNKMYNTSHCGIEHFPSKHYYDCSEINFFQSKQCALVAVDEILTTIVKFPHCTPYHFGLTSNGENFFTENQAVEYYLEVKQEIENL
jgi:hypothetical protein